MLLSRVPYPHQYYQWSDYAVYLHRIEGLRRLERFGVTRGCNSEDYHARVVEGKILQLVPDDPESYPEFIRPHEWTLPFPQLMLLYINRVLPWQIHANQRLSQMNRYRTLGMPAPTIYPLVTRHNEFRRIYSDKNPKAALRLFIEGKAPAFAAMEAYICMYRQAVADCSRKRLHHSHQFIADHYRNEPLYQLERDDQRNILHIRYLGQEPALRNCYSSFFQSRDAVWNEVARHEDLRTLYRQVPIHDYELPTWNMLLDRFDLNPESFHEHKFTEDPAPVFYHGDFADEAWYDHAGYFDDNGIPHLRKAPVPETVSPAPSPTNYDDDGPAIPFTDPDSLSGRPHGLNIYANDPLHPLVSRFYLAKLPGGDVIRERERDDGKDSDVEMDGPIANNYKTYRPPTPPISYSAAKAPSPRKPTTWLEDAAESLTSDSDQSNKDKNSTDHEAAPIHVYPFGYTPFKMNTSMPTNTSKVVDFAHKGSKDVAATQRDIPTPIIARTQDPRRVLPNISLPALHNEPISLPKGPPSPIDKVPSAATKGRTFGPHQCLRHRTEPNMSAQAPAALSVRANATSSNKRRAPFPVSTPELSTWPRMMPSGNKNSILVEVALSDLSDGMED